jgi:hypothetical protein
MGMDCSKINADYVITCINYATLNNAGGSCDQIGTKPSKACDFQDDQTKLGGWSYLPEAIGDACLGKVNCNFSLNYNGFAYNGKNYDLRSSLATG